jgi:hypothetical protein
VVVRQSIKKTINEYLALEKQTSESIFTQLFLYICSLETKDSPSDLYILGKLLKTEDIKKIIDYFDGDLIRIPRKEEYRNAMLVSLCFFLKVIKGYSWADIKDFISLPENSSDILSTISVGRKINSIQDSLGNDIIKALQNMEIDNIDTLFGYFGDIKGYINE